MLIFATKITSIMKITVKLCFVLALVFTACQESMEQRAVREAREYTERMCPTPVYNDTRTDSVTFDVDSRTYTYHCSFHNNLDDSLAINNIKDQLNKQLKLALTDATNIKSYKEAGFNFQYICRSAKHPETILYQATFKAEEINR